MLSDRFGGREQIIVRPAVYEIRAEDRLSPRPDRDSPLIARGATPVCFIRPQNINEPSMIVVDKIARPHLAHLARPHAGQTLDPDHVADYSTKLGERRLDRLSRHRLDRLDLASG